MPHGRAKHRGEDALHIHSCNTPSHMYQNDPCKSQQTRFLLMRSTLERRTSKPHQTAGLKREIDRRRWTKDFEGTLWTTVSCLLTVMTVKDSFLWFFCVFLRNLAVTKLFDSLLMKIRWLICSMNLNIVCFVVSICSSNHKKNISIIYSFLV